MASANTLLIKPALPQWLDSSIRRARAPPAAVDGSRTRNGQPSRPNPAEMIDILVLSLANRLPYFHVYKPHLKALLNVKMWALICVLHISIYFSEFGI